MNTPIKNAYSLAQRMRKFRAATEETAPTIKADDERSEVVRQNDRLRLSIINLDTPPNFIKAIAKI